MVKSEEICTVPGTIQGGGLCVVVSGVAGGRRPTALVNEPCMLEVWLAWR